MPDGVFRQLPKSLEVPFEEQPAPTPSAGDRHARWGHEIDIAGITVRGAGADLTAIKSTSEVGFRVTKANVTIMGDYK